MQDQVKTSEPVAGLVATTEALRLPPTAVRVRLVTGSGLHYAEVGEALGVCSMTAWRWTHGVSVPRDRRTRAALAEFFVALNRAVAA
jgi:hypothetical protein